MLGMNSTHKREAKVYLERDMVEGRLHRIGLGEAIIHSSRAPDKETANEDAAALVPFSNTSGVLAIADGAGGQRDGAQASALAIDELKSAINDAAKADKDLREAINQAVTALGTGAATTLAVVELQDQTVRTYHVGDSMILVTGQKGKIKLQTISHSPVGYAVHAGLLDETEAMHHEDRHLVSNIIGSDDMHIEVGSTAELAPRDTLVMASDGLFDNLHLEEIVEYTRRDKLPTIAQKLANACRKRMTDASKDRPSKPDDLTFILFRRN
jgi:serine/threonine protein phosphatase PrpC